MHADIAIIGAGVIGMMTARELAASGAEVLLIEKSLPAQEASWAGGGIVSPLYPWRYSEAITALASWSQISYVHLSEALLEETGLDPELRQKGLLMLAVEDQLEALAWAKDYQRNLVEVDSRFISELEPNLPATVESAVWMPEVASIRNPRLGQSLRRSLQNKRNVRFATESEVLSAEITDGRLLSIMTTKGKISADKFILSAGAWTGDLAKVFGVNVSVEPVKGQMLVIKSEVGFVNRVIMQNGRYLIPRADGRVLVGSTLEFEGYDKTTHAEAADNLHQSALEIMPALSQFNIEHHWAGLRPGCPNGIPYIDQAPGFENFYVNAGHYRNGLVLAPASCRLMADIVLGRKPIIDPGFYTFEASRGDRLI